MSDGSMTEEPVHVTSPAPDNAPGSDPNGSVVPSTFTTSMTHQSAKSGTTRLATAGSVCR